MDFYLTTLALGAVGLVAMAFSGFARHGQHGSHGHGASHGGAHAHGGAAAHGTHGHTAHAHQSHGHQGSHGHAAHFSASRLALSLMSPRVLFSVCLGLGTTGLLLRPVTGGALLFLGALAGGVIFERLLVTPIWNLAFRFASEPAHTLESAAGGDATAVTTFDANGQGLISIEIDGQVMQLLGTLQANDRALRARVGAGARLRVEDVDAARNRCTVSLL